MTSHQFREARPENIAAIIDLILKHGPNPWNWVPHDEVVRHVGQIETGEVDAVGAWDGAALQGVVTFRQTQHFARYQPEGRTGEPHGYICEAVVHRNAVGQGLGARLIAAVLDVLKARGMREVYIDRHEENAASVGMMRKAGFTVIDTFAEPEKRPYGSGRTTICRIISKATQLDKKYEKAAEEYARIRDDFFRIDAVLRSLTISPDDQNRLRNAWRAAARARMRAISNRVGKFSLSWSTLNACDAIINRRPVEIDHAVPVNLVHNKVLGITSGESWGTSAHPPSPHDAGRINQLIRRFVVGVLVTGSDHKSLLAQSMPKEVATWSEDALFGRYEKLPVHRIGGCRFCETYLLDDFLSIVFAPKKRNLY